MSKTVPNQWVAEVQKQPCNKSNIYSTINDEAVRLAMKDLTSSQFQVWYYFAKNQQGFTFAVSPAAALKDYGIKKDTFHSAVKKLKEKRYLVNDTTKGANYWIFYETPAEDTFYVTKA